MDKPHEPRAARRQRLPRHQKRGGGVPERQAGDAERHVLQRLHVVADPVARQLTGADERRLHLVVDGEIACGDVQRLDESGTGAGHVHRVERLRAETSRDLGRGRRLERVTGDPAVDEEVDIGRRHAVLSKAGGRRARRELAGRQRVVLVEVAHLGITSVEDIADALLDRVPFGRRAAERVADA